MKQLSSSKLAAIVETHRKAMKLTQAQLAKMIGLNRSLLSRLENGTFSPSVDQLLALSETLGFDLKEVTEQVYTAPGPVTRPYRIAVAGTGYVGLYCWRSITKSPR